MTTEPALLPVAIIGGGFSGTIAAIQLSRKLPPEQPILVFERNERIGTGVAYATDNAAHLLNVRASNMSALADDPGHFETWLKNRAVSESQDWHQTEAGLFSSRRLYARYIADIFDHAAASCTGVPRPRWIRCSIVDCRRAGDIFILTDQGGNRHHAAAVILATGHSAPVPGGDPRHVTNPWDLSYLDGLDPAKPVLVEGTALTMVDIVLTLRGAGFAGPITGLSRRGVSSHAHRPSPSWPIPDFSPAERASVRAVMRRLRREVAKAAECGIDWRSVIDSIRPITADLWVGWPKAQRQRFLRHARRWWDIHRHRMAPPNEAAISREIAEGGLSLSAGRILAIQSTPDALQVTYRLKGGREESGPFQRVINATGLASLGQGSASLIDQLLAEGLIRLDPLEIGLDVTDRLEVVDGSGAPVPGLWAVGPIVRGTFWECIAVPDIRRQAADCAAKVSDYLAVTTTFPVICGCSEQK